MSVESHTEELPEPFDRMFETRPPTVKPELWDCEELLCDGAGVSCGKVLALWDWVLAAEDPCVCDGTGVLWGWGFAAEEALCVCDAEAGSVTVPL